MTSSKNPFDPDEVIARGCARRWRPRAKARCCRGTDKFALNFTGADSLTPREKDVLAQIAHGASNKEAGRTLGIQARAPSKCASRPPFIGRSLEPATPPILCASFLHLWRLKAHFVIACGQV